MKLVAVVLVVGFWAMGLAAQAPQKDTTTVDGYTHPEQIPDAVVYMHWYIVVSHGGPGATIRLQASGLSDADQSQMQKAMGSFKVQYDALTAAWTAKVEAAKGAPVDDTAYTQSKIDLLNQTNKEVQALLSPAGWTQFQAYMQQHKRFTKMSPGKTV